MKHTLCRIKRQLVFATGLWLAVGMHAQAACGPYDVAYYEYGSFYFQNDKGIYAGIDKDVVEELARRSGCTLNGFLDARIRTWTHLQDGSLDMTVSGIDTPERREFATFVPYFKSRNYVLVNKAVAEKTPTLAAFTANAELRLAVVKSFHHGPKVDAWVEKLRLQGRVDEYADAEMVARIFAIGRAQAFLSEPGVWAPLLKKNDIDGKVAFNDWFPSDAFSAGLVLSRKRVRPEDVQRMQRAIKSMRDDGTLERIYRRYMPVGVARDLLR